VEPELSGSTWRDLAIYSLEQKQAIQQCNIDKGSIKALLDKDGDL